VLKFFDTIRNQPLQIGNNNASNYLLDVKSVDSGVVVSISQKDLEDRIRTGHYVQLG
jgi:hypothetical protein